MPRTMPPPREMLPKHGDSALAQQVYGTVHAKLTASIEESAAKQKYIKTAIEVAQKATDLDPNSMELAHFFASLLFDYMAENEAHEPALDEPKRAPSEESTVDASKETAASNPETSINQVQGEQKNLVLRSSLPSISTRMKTLNDKKNNLNPVRSINEQVEYHVPKSPTAPTAPLLSTNKEIDTCVAAIQLLKQQHTDPFESLYTTSSESWPHSKDEHSLAASSSSSPAVSREPMHLEELVEKDAEDRSVAARVALAKLAKNDKKDSWKGESKQMVEMKPEERKLEEAMEYQRSNLEQTLEYQTMIEEGAQVHQYDRMAQFEAVMANYQNDLQSNNTCDISGIKAGANSGKQLGAEFNAEPTRGQ